MTWPSQSLIVPQIGGKENGLSFSIKKTTVLLFHRKRKTSFKIDRNIFMEGKVLKLSNDVKYLGLTLNKDLTWGRHLKSRIAKCKGKLLRLKTAIGIKWGPSPKLTLWAYESLIVPILTYGSIVWGHTNFTKSQVRNLSTLNRLALIGLSSIRRSTPTAGLEVILNAPPLHLLIKERGLASFIRIKRHFTWDGVGKAGKKGHVKMWDDLCGIVDLFPKLVDPKVMHQNWVPPFLAKFDAKADTHCLIGQVTQNSRTCLNYSWWSRECCCLLASY